MSINRQAMSLSIQLTMREMDLEKGRMNNYLNEVLSKIKHIYKY